MKNAKKFICILVLGCIVCTHSYNVYQTCYATEVVAVGGLASVGVALLGLGAIAGVGMDLDNNRRFNDLSDEEKQRIENGLATNFEDVALQRGASIEKIKNWTTDLCNGVLDKTSECWGIFKDWVKNVSLSDKWQIPDVPSSSVSINTISGIGSTNKYGAWSITSHNLSIIENGSYYTNNKDRIHTWVVQNVGASPYSSSKTSYKVFATDGNDSYLMNTASGYSWTFDSEGNLFSSGQDSLSLNSALVDTRYMFVAVRSSIPVYYDDVNINGIGSISPYFTTNTDYLEKLKGQDEDVIDVIDVTDIKNPIIETRPNSLANINWNRGTRRTNNNKDDDDNKMVTGLVPMDVWYEQIDDEQEEMKNAVVVYDNYIQEHPQEKDTYFISTTPVTNINNYFNTLPVVNLPAQGTIVNNNYEYNNYNNNNVTIYQEPYNTGIIPTFPDFKNKFPFCIPFDLYEFFVVFLAEKEAPKIEIPFPIIDNTNHQLTVEHITIDLAPYEYLSDVLRVMLFVLFCVGLMLLTRQLIKG